VKRLFILLLVVGVTDSAICQSAVTGKDLFAWVQGIEGKSPEGRKEFVKNELVAMGLQFKTAFFSHELKDRKTITGENIIASLGKGNRNVVVGAHYDAVPGSPGANDNGGGVAVVLGLLKSMKEFEWSYKVDFCFFDQEEVGLIGSREFVRTYSDSSIHLAMINLDVEGMGDAVYVGPVGGGDDDLLMPMLRTIARTAGYTLYESPHYPSSDHLSFAERSLENISVSIVPTSDVPLLIDAIQKGWKIDPEKVPAVMKTMHTPRDSSIHVSPMSLSMSLEFVKTLLLSLDDAGTQ